MTFLNPAILWALLAVAVPIIVHFFNLQRPRQVLFSNISFVKEVQKTVVRRIKFKQWLLLLTRILAICALVFAFANPVILQENQTFFNGNRSVAVIIDNSYSMNAGNEKGAYFPQAISLARSIVQAYSLEDEYLVMPLDELQLNASFSDQDNALEYLRTLQIQQNTRSHAEVLNFKDALFSQANYPFKELYFISDFQRSTILADSNLNTSQDSSLLIKYIPLGTREQKNIYIKDSKVSSQIIEKDQSVNLTLQLVNESSTPANDLKVQVYLESKPVAFVTPSLEPERTMDLSIPIVPQASGWLDGYIEIDDYPIEFDNRRYFTLYVPEKEKVLVVEGTSSPNVRILYESLFEAFETTFINARALSSIQPGDYRSILLVGVPTISSGVADKLRDFLNQGGSLFHIMGPEADLESYNSFLGSLNVGTLQAQVQAPSGRLAEEVDLDHPVFKGIFTEAGNRRNFDAPEVFKYYPFRLNNGRVHNRIISLGPEAPLFVESQVEEGLLFTLTTFPSSDWTDLPIKTLFAPLMFRTTQIMNQSQNVSLSQEIGETTPVILRSGSNELIRLLDGEGKELIPEQYSQNGGTILNFEPLAIEAGNFQLVQEDQLLQKIAFNISDTESRMAFATRLQLDDLLNDRGLSYIELLDSTPEAISDRIKMEKEGTPLWKYFVILGLVLLFAEILIIKLFKGG